MTGPTSSKSSRDESTSRFRAILEGDKDEESTPTPISPRSFLDRLPRADQTASPPPEPARQNPPAARPSREKPRREAQAGLKSRRERMASAYWTVTSVIGLAVDAVLIAIVIILLFYVRRLNIKMNELLALSDLPLDTVEGLYENFEIMNNAHIVTNIPYQTEIPVAFDIQINQQTEVVLSQDTRINGARVTLVTGGLEINGAPANIILPAGTRLPINLILTVPVNKMVPVSLNVPVDINLAETDLGDAFTGLMDVIKPLYCLLDPLAVDKDEMAICEKTGTPQLNGDE